MNKYLLMITAALTTYPAAASTHHLRLDTTFCSYFDVTWSGKEPGLYAVKEVGVEACSSNSVFYEVGISTRTGVPRMQARKSMAVAIPVPYPNIGVLAAFSLPFQQGGTVVLLGTTNGTTVLVLNSYTYGIANNHGSLNGVRRNPHTSIAMKIKEFLGQTPLK